MVVSLAGEWHAKWLGNQQTTVQLPGTLDSNQIGLPDVAKKSIHPDQELGFIEEKGIENQRIKTRLTRKKTYEGTVIFEKIIDMEFSKDKRVFLEIERARHLKLLIDEHPIDHFITPSLSTPHFFEVTAYLRKPCKVTIISDNTYPGMPYDGIVYSSAATNETQTNWNGILGDFRLIEQEQSFISYVAIHTKANEARITIEVDSSIKIDERITIDSIGLKESIKQEVTLNKGKTILNFTIALSDNLIHWDLLAGNLYKLKVGLTNGSSKIVSFGVRDFLASSDGYFELNKRRLFIRSETNCCVFPETGHPPMNIDEWRTVIKMYQSYGVNLIRFHSYCPPEAAFYAADELGMLMQPELSYWNPIDAFESEESVDYFRKELEQILRTYTNHPSFVMLSFGNELHADEKGHQQMNTLLKFAKKIDPTRLYANGSNNHYGRWEIDLENDYYTSSNYFENRLRGTYAGTITNPEFLNDDDDDVARVSGYLNEKYPDAKTNFNHSMQAIRQSYFKPVISFEVGQFEILPDFDEIRLFKGVTTPDNYRLIQEKVIKKGWINRWKSYVEATGELAHLTYREEIEAAYRTKDLAGISLLGLQDFPGQGTALVGMLNAHLIPKPFSFSQPERFKQFFKDELPLILLDKYTYVGGETLTAEIKIFNYGRKRLKGTLHYSLIGSQTIRGEIPSANFPPGNLYAFGPLSIILPEVIKPERYNLIVEIDGCKNEYPVWIYPNRELVKPASVYVTKTWNKQAKAILEGGGNVFLTPDANRKNLPTSIPTQFTTDFWSVGTFTSQAGGMGQFIDVSHPIFNDFPTNSYSEWQWWAMASQRAIVLPKEYETIVAEIDSYAYLRPMAKLIEFNYGNGKLLLSSMGLHQIQKYPEARALLQSVYHYMDSSLFNPTQEITFEQLSSLVFYDDQPSLLVK